MLMLASNVAFLLIDRRLSHLDAVVGFEVMNEPQ
jgi:hypothetical protein